MYIIRHPVWERPCPQDTLQEAIITGMAGKEDIEESRERTIWVLERMEEDGHFEWRVYRSWSWVLLSESSKRRAWGSRKIINHQYLVLYHNFCWMAFSSISVTDSYFGKDDVTVMYWMQTVVYQLISFCSNFKSTPARRVMFTCSPEILHMPVLAR